MLYISILMANVLPEYHNRKAIWKNQTRSGTTVSRQERKAMVSVLNELNNTVF
jgi:hypothetical protein